MSMVLTEAGHPYFIFLVSYYVIPIFHKILVCNRVVKSAETLTHFLT